MLRSRHVARLRRRVLFCFIITEEVPRFSSPTILNFFSVAGTGHVRMTLRGSTVSMHLTCCVTFYWVKTDKKTTTKKQRAFQKTSKVTGWRPPGGRIRFFLPCSSELQVWNNQKKGAQGRVRPSLTHTGSIILNKTLENVPLN